MALEIDLAGKHIRASVGRLVALWHYEGKRLGLLGKLRTELGQQVHAEYRAEHTEQNQVEQSHFEPEVTIKWSTEVDGFDVEITGRIDGLFQRGNAFLLQEVKSVTHSAYELEQLTAHLLPDYCLQLRLYCLGFGDVNPGAKLRAELVLVSVSDGSRRTLKVDIEAEQTKIRLHRLLRRAISDARLEQQLAAKRTKYSQALTLPFAQPRPHQSELLEFIASGLRSNHPVLAMAPTGIGKTVATLLPALRYALEQNRSLIFLTAKTTQQQLVAQTFEQVVSHAQLTADALTGITLRAKDQMCPPGHRLCHPDICPFLFQFLSRVASSGIVEELQQTHVHLTPEVLLEAGGEQTLCPFELSLAVAKSSELIIGDYNYFYDPVVALFMGDSAAMAPVVAIDEAHNLFDRARGYYSPFIKRSTLSALLEEIAAGTFVAPKDREQSNQQTLTGIASPIDGGPLFAQLQDYLRELIQEIDDNLVENAGNQTIENCQPIELAEDCWEHLTTMSGQLLLLYLLYRKQHKLVERDDPIIELLRTVPRVRALAIPRQPEMVPFLAGSDSPYGMGLGICCVNPARQLLKRHRQAQGVVAISATLSPLSYFCDVLGLSPLYPVTTSTPSPFPAENHKVVVVPTVSTRYRDRDSSSKQIGQLITEIVDVHPGKYMVFFSSFAYLAKVRPFISLAPSSVMIQIPNMAQVQRQATLEKFRRDSAPKVLLAVLGGSYAEGIDLPGDALIGAIVVGPGLPKVGFERALMRQHFDEYGEAGFAYAMLYPGMQRVIQSAGRVIRTMEDVGIVALLGSRFAEQAYAECLPPHWYRYSFRELLTSQPQKQLEAFWREVMPSEDAPA